jgi:ribonuclease E
MFFAILAAALGLGIGVVIATRKGFEADVAANARLKGEIQTGLELLAGRRANKIRNDGERTQVEAQSREGLVQAAKRAERAERGEREGRREHGKRSEHTEGRQLTPKAGESLTEAQATVHDAPRIFVEGQAHAALPVAAGDTSVSRERQDGGRGAYGKDQGPPVEVAEGEARLTEATAAPAPAFTLPIDDLQALAEAAGLQWVNSDAEKVRLVQEAMAAEPAPVHVPREKKAVAIDEGPTVLVETRREPSQVKRSEKRTEARFARGP